MWSIPAESGVRSYQLGVFCSLEYYLEHLLVNLSYGVMRAKSLLVVVADREFAVLK